MFRWLTLVILFLSSVTWAQRVIPEDMDIAVLKQVDYPYITLGHNGISWIQILTLGWLDNGKVLQTTQDVRIRDERNRFIVRGKLAAYTGKAVAIRRDGTNNINEIWILTEPEYYVFQQRAAQQQ